MSGMKRRGKPEVVTEAELVEPPEMVWRALTTPALLAEWLGTNTMPDAPASGTRFAVDVPGEPGGQVACEILESVPHERLSYAWTSADPDAARPLDTVVVFELAPMPNGGTRLRIIHRDAVAGTRYRATMLLGTRRGCGRRQPVRGTFAARPGSPCPTAMPASCSRRLAA